jgi:hypothetical protein
VREGTIWDRPFGLPLKSSVFKKNIYQNHNDSALDNDDEAGESS